jgi:hypothetical protein
LFFTLALDSLCVFIVVAEINSRDHIRINEEGDVGVSEQATTIEWRSSNPFFHRYSPGPCTTGAVTHVDQFSNNDDDNERLSQVNLELLGADTVITIRSDSPHWLVNTTDDRIDQILPQPTPHCKK